MTNVPLLRLVVVGCSLLVLATSVSPAGELTFDERVEAQRAIERVYYSYQSGAQRPFDEAVPPELLEQKVRKYLAQSVALERFWQTPVTGAALQRELERVAASTHFPDRLRQIYDALGNDPVLLRECLSRPILVDRLTRNFFAYDSTIHAEALHEADALRSDLVRGDADPWDSDRVGPVEETRGAFLIRTALAEEFDRAQIATYSVRKRKWDDWWSTVKPLLDPSEVTVARAPLPSRPEGEVIRNSGPSCPAPDTWDPGVLDDAPYQRAGPLALWTGSMMLIWGGHDDNGSRYDPLIDVWTPISAIGAPESRNGAAIVWTGSEMVVWGGVGEAAYLTTGGRYDPITDTWTATSTANPPPVRTGHSAVWTGSEMIVWGGYHSGVVLSSGGRYDPATDSWVAMSTFNAPAPREDATAIWTGTEMIVWGGQDQPTTFNSGGRYDPSTDTWSATTLTGAPGPRTTHTAVWTGSRMIVWGGGVIHGTAWNDGGVYDPVADSWDATSTSGAPPARTTHSAVWDGTAMLIWGGLSNGVRVDTGGSYDPAANSWVPTSTVNAPRGRHGHSAIWTGSEMIVWGGRGVSNKALNTGGRYVPSSGNWTPTSTGGPIPRASHSAAWTGNLMIVWGGSSQEETPAFPENSGGRYDPTLDSWTPTSTTNAPSARISPRAVWTGQEMFVAGGYPVAVGGLYDPVSDTWRAGITVRDRATLVWTGTEVLAWGGVDSSLNPLNTGTRYDPATGTSVPISTLGAPDARYYHGAVWTGDRMVVWGGTDVGGASAFNSGGKYDPATDDWVPASSGLGGRHSFSTVWTGEEMIVWGGSDDSGARYDPDTNLWAPMSTVDEPPVEIASHVAAWTGTKMIVWGNAFENTGAVYDLQSDTWSPTSTVGAPSARTAFSAVWTGEAFIVWGGNERSSQEKRSDGSRYIVDSDDDGLVDGCDNCPLDDNPDQTNVDGDIVGGACDCDDTAPTVYPGAVDLCDGINNDCDDVDWPSIAGTSDADSDTDGWSICGGDCDDSTSSTHPGAEESCNGVDDDCNGSVDDADGDGDAVPDCVDNCPQLAIAEQGDWDDDGQGDACDADDGPIYLYFTSEDTLDWATETGFQTWNVYSGDVAVMVQTGVYSQLEGANPLAERQCGLPGSLSTGMLTSLGPGELAFFLTSGVSGNVESDLDWLATPRPNTNPCE